MSWQLVGQEIWQLDSLQLTQDYSEPIVAETNGSLNKSNLLYPSKHETVFWPKEKFDQLSNPSINQLIIPAFTKSKRIN